MNQRLGRPSTGLSWRLQKAGRLATPNVGIPWLRRSSTSGRARQISRNRSTRSSTDGPRGGWSMVELMGIEPTTPCLQSRCSSQLSYSPEASQGTLIIVGR